MTGKKELTIRQATKADFNKLREKFSDTQFDLDPNARQKLLDVGLYLGSMAVLSLFLVVYYSLIWNPHKLSAGHSYPKSQL